MRQRKVVRATRSPLNVKQWCLDLDCGHELWVSDKKAPKLVGCHECPSDPNDETNKVLAKADARRGGGRSDDK